MQPSNLLRASATAWRSCVVIWKARTVFLEGGGRFQMHVCVCASVASDSCQVGWCIADRSIRQALVPCPLARRCQFLSRCNKAWKIAPARPGSTSRLL
eukprot:315025-Chlamydomonas_euryale.AAC.1